MRRSLAVGLLGVLLGGALALFSDGFYHDDDVWHFLIARDAWGEPGTMLNAWGRPGYTIPAMVATRLAGLTGARLLSVLAAALTAWLAYDVARRIARDHPAERRSAWLAPALLWLQPLAATLALTTLTETLAGLWITLALALWLRGRAALAAAVLSLSFVTRDETAALAPLLLLAAFAERRRPVAVALLLAWAPVAWLAAVELLELPPWCSPLARLTKEHSPEYGRGTWFHFVPLWLLASGGAVLALAAVGAAALGRRARLVTAVAAGLFLLHTVLYRFGLFASGGYARFLVPAAGPVAALAAAGFGFVRSRSRTGAWILLALAVLQAAALVRPLRIPDGRVPIGTLRITRPLAPSAAAEHSAIRRLARRARAVHDGPLLGSHGLIRILDPAGKTGRTARIEWRNAPPGTPYVWDSKYGDDPAWIAELAARGEIVATEKIEGFLATLYRKVPDPR